MVQTITSDKPLPFLHLDPETLERRHCFDAWRETFRAMYDVNPLSDNVSGKESVKAWLVNNLIFTDVEFSSQSFRHDRRHATNSDYMSLQVYRKGLSRGSLAGTSFLMAPGDVHLFDFSREFFSIDEDSIVAGVIIPHDAIGYEPGRHPAHVSFSGDSAPGRFLANAFFALLDELPYLRDEEGKVLADGFCGLVQSLFAPTPFEDLASRRYRAERREAIHSYLDRNLSDPNLGADSLCDTFNMSRSSIYREFAEFGGVARYLVERRLDWAWNELMLAPPAHGHVKETANRCGFSDPAHFSRLFRRRFGVPPTAVMNVESSSRPSVALSPASGAVPLSDWFEGIRCQAACKGSLNRTGFS